MLSQERRRPSRGTMLCFAAFTVFVVCYEVFLWFSGGIVSASAAQSAVHFIDVGQGDCALILSGEDAVLIDAGLGTTSERVTIYLQDVGVSRLTAAIATHAHEDHIGGMAAVLRQFPTDTLYLPSQTANTRTYASMLDAAKASGTQVLVPVPGEVLRFGAGAEMHFLAPPPDSVYENLNDSSIISMFSQNGQRILFTGDAETLAETELLATHPDLACDVLKVAHHGSNTSSTNAFLDAAAPRIAVISCGKYNDYGHPHPKTLEKLRARGIEVHCTADEGTYIYPIIQEEGANAA